MLAHTLQASSRFTRRDGVRFAAATTVLVAVLSAIFAVDIVPQPIAIEVGAVAPADIVAPRALTYTSQVRTEAARQAARDAVPPQYDYTPENAAAVAAEQAAEYARRIGPIEAAFVAPLTPEERAQILGSVLADELSEAARTTLVKLSPERWAAVRDEAARVLDTVERSELRDTEVAAVRARLAGRMVGLSPAEAQLASELIGPLLVPNSSYSEELTNQARDRAAEAVTPSSSRSSAARSSSAGASPSTSSPTRRSPPSASRRPGPTSPASSATPSSPSSSSSPSSPGSGASGRPSGTGRTSSFSSPSSSSSPPSP
ncbi:MAG: hypothetical protein KatS3mg065_0182 [Chloroflexota bacterium]|nr:MAG: hypothetical protein KatS3mg065_0182 [Chloroflexota bacterium]